MFVMSLKAFKSRGSTDMTYLNSIDIAMVVLDGIGF